MPLIALTCPNCSGDIQLDDTKEFGFCMYCGKKVMIERIRQTVVIDNSKNIENLIVMAEDATIHNNIKTAEECINKVLEMDINNPRAWLIKGGIAAKARRWTEAMNSWKKALVMDAGKNTVEMLGTWTDLLAGSIFNEVKTIHGNLRVSWIHEILKDSSIPCAGYVYEKVFDKILGYKYENTWMFELSGHMYTHEAIIRASVFSGNNPGKMLARCKKWTKLLDTYEGKIKNLNKSDAARGGMMSKKPDKSFMEALELMVKEGRMICETFMKGLSEVPEDKWATIQEYWKAHMNERFEMHMRSLEIYQNLFDGRKKFSYPALTKETAKEYEKQLKMFVTMNGTV